MIKILYMPYKILHMLPISGCIDATFPFLIGASLFLDIYAIKLFLDSDFTCGIPLPGILFPMLFPNQFIFIH